MRSLFRSSRSLLLATFAIGAFAACSSIPEIGGGNGGTGNGDGDGDTSTGGDGFNLGGEDGMGSGGEDGNNMGGGAAVISVCGDSVIEAPENCDDDNTKSGDGCSKSCQTETGFACPIPGEACVQLAVCGDGNLGVGEECDDANKKSGDGCTDKCFVEVGWECPTAGSRCIASRCGDGELAGNEQCEDGDDPPESGDGCSDKCRIEPGYFCTDVGEACKETVCGNGEREGDEACDDGNGDVGDGCTPLCEREPTCVKGACTSTCGDGMILAGDDDEECDDGNLNNGDGCSNKCKPEMGYACSLQTEDPPDKLNIPIIYRDMVATNKATNGGVAHPDFNVFSGSGTLNLVKDQLLNGKPQYAGICDNNMADPHPECPDNKQLTTEANFNKWYNDSSMTMRVDQTLQLDRNMSGQYEFDSGAGFFPLNDLGWVGAGKENAVGGNNFSFTSELRYWFELKGGEVLTFRGDDDVWVFINNRLMIDLGGLHSAKQKIITLDPLTIAALGMQTGHIYEVVLFHAERKENQSNFRLTLNGFVKTKSQCVADCGDGIVAGEEACDDGENGGKYGYCKADCSGLAERCGDGSVQKSEGEVCDDGTNLTSYDFQMSGGCGPGCQPPARCGDKKVDIAFGEQCDDGNKKDGDGCESNCTFRAKCGDGKVNKADGETCDDGNRTNGDGCSQFCTTEVIIVR